MTEQTERKKNLSFGEASFDFEPTFIDECLKEPIEAQRIVGQPRALRSLMLGLSLSKSGYNVFVSGNSGSGRQEAVRYCTQELRKDLSSLKDIVYVYNFLQPDSPSAITLEAGEGEVFFDACERFNQEILQLTADKEHFLEKALDLEAELEQGFSQIQLVSYFTHLKADLVRQNQHIQYLDADACKQDPIASKYRVNLLVNHAKTKLRPLVIETHPNFANLFGSVDPRQNIAHLALHAGSLHQAYGGFIVIDAEELLSEPGLWDALRRFIDEHTLSLESRALAKGELKSSAIRPQSVALPLKVILIGSDDTYDTFSEGDERFLTLFKISAQFDYSMPCTKQNVCQSISNLQTYATSHKLLPLEPSAFAQLLRYSCWYVESRDELSTQLSQLYDLLEEANWWARKEGKSVIDGELILKVNDERGYANGISESRINEAILTGEMIISLSGTKIGVVNGLAVMDRGAASFGTPTVISCTVAPGNEGIVNIEHEAGLSGEIHDKGLLIMEGYLRKHYARNFPLSIYAGIAFEQSYAEVDGDSASSSELYALLSAIGELPIRQDIAVTGSVNQMGMIQPVGGINEKIEGFFRTCQTTGLTGKQGVIIPIQNVRNLILPYEVLQAIKEGTFTIYPIKDIDEGMQILTDRPSGVRNAKGNYSEGNFNYTIEERLRRMYQALLANRG